MGKYNRITYIIYNVIFINSCATVCIYKLKFTVFSPLTKVKLINELNEREADLGVNESVSWHTEYKDSAWIFIGRMASWSGSGANPARFLVLSFVLR